MTKITDNGKPYLSSYLTKSWRPETGFKDLKGIYISVSSTNCILSLHINGQSYYSREYNPKKVRWLKIV